MAVIVPDDLVAASGLTEDELRLELSVALYRGARCTLGQAARIAGLAQDAMLRELGNRGIAVNYDVEDLKQDLTSLEKLFPA